MLVTKRENKKAAQEINPNRLFHYNFCSKYRFALYRGADSKLPPQ